MLFHKGFYDMQHWRKVKIICLCMIDLVKNLRNVLNVSLSREAVHHSSSLQMHHSNSLQIAIHVYLTARTCLPVVPEP